MTATIHSNRTSDAADSGASRLMARLRATAGHRGTASLLLVALVAALLVVADQMIQTWADGRLLAAWMGLWLVAFVALVLLAVPMGHAAIMLGGAFKAWGERHRRVAALMARLR
jgi:hypothetical protein